MNTLSYVTAQYPMPSFSIYKSPDSQEKVETLKACFIARIDISSNNPPAVLKAKDGNVYTCVYDCRLPDMESDIPVIISFQQHTYGRFAVIRLSRGE